MKSLKILMTRSSAQQPRMPLEYYSIRKASFNGMAELKILTGAHSMPMYPEYLLFTKSGMFHTNALCAKKNNDSIELVQA